MKKLKKLIKELRLARFELLQALAYILTIGWFGYVLQMIIGANINIIIKILLVIGGLALGLFACISLHVAFSEDNE